jgi:hypothetical protein
MVKLFSIKLKRLSILLVVFLLMPDLSFSWGFYSHKRINRMAVFSLPADMFPFYKINIEQITELAVQPDKRRYAVKGEAPCHYIDLDHYGDSPIDSIPRFWNDAVNKFTEDSLLEHGIVPWKITFVFYQLKKAFVDGDKQKIIRYSADLGHYVADAHVPLHCTSNYNGQQTNQYGIHGLWESRLPELFGESYDCITDNTGIVDDVNKLAWSIVTASYQAVDSVLNFELSVTENMESDKKMNYEPRGNMMVRVYSHEFSARYHLILNGMVERRFKESIRVIASLWYTAWVDAGQPNLTSGTMPIVLPADSAKTPTPAPVLKNLRGHTD